MASTRIEFQEVNRKILTGILLVFVIVGCVSSTSKEADKKPNVILIMADDLGYSGISAFGGIDLETPALDKLAEDGVIATNFHANAPVCSPTRVSIMTGSYQQRAGLNFIYPESSPSGEKSSAYGLVPETHPSFVKLLQDAGYRTGVFGKWHLGMDESFNPVNHGFDEFRGFLKGNVDFISHMNTTPEVDWWHNTEPADEPGYATDLINQHSVDFIKESEGEPFFLYIPHAAIHTPIQGRNDPPIRTEEIYAYSNEGDMPEEEFQRRYREMIKIMDDGVKMIVEELERQEILDNTFIIFISDNGATATAAEKYPGANGFFRGSKATLYEAGTRVPAIFYYPKSMEKKKTDEMMLTMDLMPTILDITGIENNREIDGVSLLPTLVHNQPMPDRKVFWANINSIAMQDREWKLIWQNSTGFGNSGGPPELSVELFNMMIDPKEENDLKEYYPEKTDSMKAEIMEWWEEVTHGTRLEGSSPHEFDFSLFRR